MSRLTKWVNGEVWYYTKEDHYPARERTYDIDNVVEQLEKVSFVDVDEEYADNGQIMLFLHDAIEIVKGGAE